jgi:ABC-2 type transport system permease protein
MLRNVFLKTLRDRRRSLLGWAIGLTAFTTFVLAFYPTISQSRGQFDDLLRSLPPALRALSGRVPDLSPAGYLNGQYFNLLAPLLLIVFAIGFGSRTLAGEERDGTLELVVAAPLARWRIVAEKFAAMAVATLLIGVVMSVALSVGTPAFDIDVPPGNLVEAVLSAVLLGLSFGSVALAVGAATAGPSVAGAVAGSLALVAYLVDAFAPLSADIRAFRDLSPFHYYRAADPVRNGADPFHLLVLGLLTLLFLAVALVAFDRRDVRT